VPALELGPSFKRELKKKPPQLAGAIIETIKRIGDDPRYPGLQSHKLQGANGVWEAYVDRANRVTFHYEPDGHIFLRKHCNHDILRQNP